MQTDGEESQINWPMRIPFLFIAVLLTTGCSTVSYTSQKPAVEVSHCIADGWRDVSGSGTKMPVTLTKSRDYYFVDVVMVRDFPSNLPLRSMWAKVRPSLPDDAGGSSTEYRQNLQVRHNKIDRVVKECQ